MELHRVHIVLVDISGYTRFIQSHRKSLLHSEGIITKLMGKVVDAARHPLILNKLEGDAALFYALAPDPGAAARDVLEQVQGLFAAFYALLAQMSVCDCCRCEACGNMRGLDLKAIVHHGEVAIKTVRQFTELAGAEVIVAHRLLKNSIPHKQYIILTEPFYGLLGDLSGLAVEGRTEQAEGVGPVKVHVHYPGFAAEANREAFSARRAIGQRLGLAWYAFTHSLLRRRAVFTHLGL